MTKIDTVLMQRTLTKDLSQIEKAQAVNILCQAFSEDEGLTWLVGSKALMQAMTPLYFNLLLSDDNLRYDLAKNAKTGEIIGIGIWAPPSYKSSVNELAREKVEGLPEELLSKVLERMELLSKTVDVVKNEIVNDKHWRCHFIGIHPSFQGKGLGSQLLNFTFSQNQLGAKSLYLETSQPQNVAFYKKNGFQLIFEFDVPDDGPHFWSFLKKV